MTTMHEPDAEAAVPGRGGCLRALIAAPALLVLAPMAALYRSWARWRRGSAVDVTVEINQFERTGDSWARVGATIDVPQSEDGPRLMTRCVVQCAEGLGSGPQIFHLVHREPGHDETIAVPLGQTINDLAERFSLSCRRSVVEGKTLVWFSLPGGRHLGEALDPVTYDPEAPGEPETMLRTAPMNWAMVLRRRRRSASTYFELDIFVREQYADRTLEAIRRLRQ